MPKYYNLYEGDNLIAEHISATKVRERTDTQTRIGRYALTGELIDGIYWVEEAGQERRPEIRPGFWQEWEAVCKPFRRLTWVKEPGPGVYRFQK